ncbi:hypothetical protein ABI59_05870 [Acidobacteria bacterium Mor1]|nr:hypothetical protein ABI59_05870 [Acidobacteria bacterium Mor1]
MAQRSPARLRLTGCLVALVAVLTTGCGSWHRAGLDDEMQDLCDKVGRRVSLDTWERPESWVGYTAAELEEQWGAPKKVTLLDDGRVRYAFERKLTGKRDYCATAVKSPPVTAPSVLPDPQGHVAANAPPPRGKGPGDGDLQVPVVVGRLEAEFILEAGEVAEQELGTIRWKRRYRYLGAQMRTE